MAASDRIGSKGSRSLRPNGSSVRWLLWLAAGMLFGLVLGFVFGLARPRAKK
jgi:uncharacterized protein involved in exopolysaccharide biosynthesis